MNQKHGLLFGFAVIAIAAMFTFTGCPTDGNDNGDGSGIGDLPNGNLGTTFSITSEQVYTKTNDSPPVYTATSINEKQTVTISGATGTVSKTDGKLTVSITAAPAGLSPISGLTSALLPMLGLTAKRYASITPSDDTAKFTILKLITDSKNLSYEKNTTFARFGTQELVQYVYVDKNVTITGMGKSTTAGSGTIKTNDFTLNLRTGWNAIYTKTSRRTTTLSYIDTVSMAVGNPANLEWSYYK